MKQVNIEEPAQKLYILDRGWASLGSTQSKLSSSAEKGAQMWLNKVSDLSQASQTAGCLAGVCLYLAMFFCLVLCACTYLIMMTIAILFVLICGLGLGIAAGLCLATIGILRSCIWLYRRFWRMNYVCPTPYCYVRRPLPIFKCSVCQAEHHQLCPNVYGIWAHRCRCGAKLHTMERFGRHKLARICPGCRNFFNHDIGEGTNIHIPIVGGPSSGKTHYITAALDELRRSYTSLYKYSFIFSDKRQEMSFQTNVQKLTHGQTLAVTPEIAPPAYTLKVQVPGVPVPKILYTYDAAGEAYNLNERTSLQSYYEYIHGLIFIIDPCAITQFRLKYQQQIDAISSYLRPSQSEILQVHDRMVRQLEKKRGLRKRRRYPFPLAVVVTKVDALNLERVIGAEAARQLMKRDPTFRTEEEAINKLVREFLHEYRLGDLLRNLEYHFSNVRYFSCSALGRLPVPTDNSSFVPVRALDPFLWLLVQAGVVRQAHKQH